MIPSAIYSFKTSYLQTILQRRDTSINNKTIFLNNQIRLGIIKETKKWDKYCQYECFYIYKCRLRSELSQLLEHLFQRTSLVKVGQFGPFARMFLFFKRELTINTTTSTFVALQIFENLGAALEVNRCQKNLHRSWRKRKMSVTEEGLTWRQIWSSLHETHSNIFLGE